MWRQQQGWFHLLAVLFIIYTPLEACAGYEQSFIAYPNTPQTKSVRPLEGDISRPSDFYSTDDARGQYEEMMRQQAEQPLVVIPEVVQRKDRLRHGQQRPQR